MSANRSDQEKRKEKRSLMHSMIGKWSLSRLTTVIILIMVSLTLIGADYIFISLYRNSMAQNAFTASEQAVRQVLKTVENYTDDIQELMDVVKDHLDQEEVSQYNFVRNLLSTRKDVVALTTYDENGNMENCWAGDVRIKERWLKNLSYQKMEEGRELNISSPHVVSLFQNSYPWVVTITEKMENGNGSLNQIALDIRFSNIAGYVDDVGIGQRGYCFIADENGDIVYHPQQQLINFGIKEEKKEELSGFEDGMHRSGSVIYTIQTLESCGWRIVGVCYADEMIEDKVREMIHVSLLLLFALLLLAVIIGSGISAILSRPSRKLADAMKLFEQDAENFRFESVYGTGEINQLSDSFAHMVLRIQNLMEKVRQEEVTLRKTELNALQAQINPHFLYNTLSSIEWMCEEERNEEAAEMVNALAQLFRISISKGHELITIDREIQHAESYLKIQKFRYKNQFTYEFDIEESCRTYYCNKITLQPIIENAIYHGIDRMVDEGRIEISVHSAGEDVVMAVEDNGVGMTDEECREILQRERTDKTGIGIKNVNDRIQIYFGSGYGISIQSELDKGTRVEIRMPKLETEKYEK